MKWCSEPHRFWQNRRLKGYPQLSMFWRRVQRFFSRGEWMRRLFFLGYDEDTREGEGLILIQVDGLARVQFERALKKGRMPFLRRLLRKHGYEMHSFYSGMPASTPAVQAEIFYGHRCAVPAWDFYRNDTGAYRSMFEQVSASEIEEEIKETGRPLLEGGSGYCNVYGGGAATANFCASHLGWNYLLRWNPLGILAGILLHWFVAVRLIARILLEIVIGIYDLFGGIRPGELWAELKFVAVRVAVSIFMRDIATLGAKMDAARGIPVIHVNYLGYDEHSHRRGPSSLYAHWTLKGIDYCIGRIYRTAMISSRRRYKVWIYSDHGQEKVVPYHRLTGKPIAEGVLEVLRREGVNLEHLRAEEQRRAPGRGTWLRARGQRQDKRRADPAAEGAMQEPRITNKGPVSNVYLFVSLEDTTRDRIAQALVRNAQIPMVLVKDGEKAALFTREGRFQLPEDGTRVLGADHPFAREVSEDLVNLAQHPHAGNFVLLGWDKKGPYITYAQENGSHAGPGPNETRGFLLLPRDAEIPELEKGYLRPCELRAAALRALADFDPGKPSVPREEPATL